MSRCPTCKSEARPRGENRAFPFCCERCKAIDLGKWFNGEYRVPERGLSPAEEPAGAAEWGRGTTGDEDEGGA